MLGPVVFVLLSGGSGSAPVSYTYSVVSVYPHDRNAFTEGLVFEDGFLFESTGLYGESTLRRVELETGTVVHVHALPDEFFGEGITVFGDRIVQLTWQSRRGLVYSRDSFDLLREFSYDTEGWGITDDGSRLIMSDGTATLYFLDPETFERTGQVEVRDNNGPVTRLNELEYVRGYVYANVWMEERIAIVDPQTGQVEGWLDLSGIQGSESLGVEDVLNGIAYDAVGDRLFVTGKRWSQVFEIELVPK